MGDNFFPTDVRVKLSRPGDEALLGRARHVLFHALNMQEQGASLPITAFDRAPDGTLITAFINVGVKIVSISTPPPPGEEPQPVPEVVAEEPVGGPAATMLSGWTRAASVSGSLFSHFRPTTNCAQAYALQPAWQTSRKLAVATTPPTKVVKPSMYSGTMKRVVQALLGMGRVTDFSPLFFGGSIANPRLITVDYGWQWDKTHGIVKTGDQNHWLVEISRDNGVLATPLPLLENTMTPEYRSRIQSRRDLGTLYVLDEFGGLPSGENFPSGPALASAITAGKVLQLKTAVEMQAFYTGRGTISAASGWAFSESGTRAHNTCAYVGPLSQNAYRGDVRESLGAANGSKIYRFTQTLYSEHWGISIDLSPHSRNARPVGIGSASLERKSSGKMCPLKNTMIIVPETLGLSSGGKDRWGKRVDVANSTITENLYGSRVEYNSEYFSRVSAEGWGAVVYVFFDGERLERVKSIDMWLGAPYPGGDFAGDSLPIRMKQALILPTYCREGYTLSGMTTTGYAAPDVSFFSGVGVVTTPPPSIVAQFLYPPYLFDTSRPSLGPFSYYFPSFFAAEAVIGPNRQYMLGLPHRVKNLYDQPTYQYQKNDLPDGLDGSHPFELNYIGGHPPEGFYQ